MSDSDRNLQGQEIDSMSTSSLVTNNTVPEDSSTQSGETPVIQLKYPGQSTTSSKLEILSRKISEDDSPFGIHPEILARRAAAQRADNASVESSPSNSSNSGGDNQLLSGNVASTHNIDDLSPSINTLELSLDSSLNVDNLEEPHSLGPITPNSSSNGASQANEETVDQQSISTEYIGSKPGLLIVSEILPDIRQGVANLSLNEDSAASSQSNDVQASEQYNGFIQAPSSVPNCPSFGQLLSRPLTEPTASSDSMNVPSLDQLINSDVTEKSESSDSTVGNMETSGRSTPVKEKIEHQELVLREFQQEIADKRATKGENDIILLPTGTGKTYVAIEVIRRHFEKNPDGKIVFFVPTKDLTTQQLKKIQIYIQPELQDKCESITGTDDLSSEQLIEKIKDGPSQVFVVTPAMIINYLERNGGIAQTSVSDFTLFIFDECHHAKKGHMYARILKKVLKAESDQQRVPQLLGMTATIGNVDKKDSNDAKVVIARICALFMMDREPSKVEQTEQSLIDATNNPSELRIEVEDERRDELSTFIREKLVRPITTEIFIRAEAKHLKLKKDYEISFPLGIGTQQFDHYVSTLMGKVQESPSDDADSRYVIRACMYLKVYHRALSIICLLNGQYGLDYLEETIKQEPRYHAIQSLYESYLIRENTMKSLAVKDTNNPKLVKLKSILDKTLRDEKSQIMIFIKERKVCHFLSRYLSDAKYKVKPYTSTSAKANGGGMNKSQQDESRRMFEEGYANILVSTSIAEEGTDIQAVNATVRYMYVKDPTSAIQIKGRSRKEDGQDCLIADTKLGRQDQRNAERSTTMKEALESIREKPEEFTKLLAKEKQSILEKISEEPPAKKRKNNKGKSKVSINYLKGSKEETLMNDPNPFSKPHDNQPKHSNVVEKTEEPIRVGKGRKRSQKDTKSQLAARDDIQNQQMCNVVPQQQPSDARQEEIADTELPQCIENMSIDDLDDDSVADETVAENDQPGVLKEFGPIRCAACKTQLGDVSNVRCYMDTHYLIMDETLPLKVRKFPLKYDLSAMLHEVKATNMLVCMAKILAESEIHDNNREGVEPKQDEKASQVGEEPGQDAEPSQKEQRGYKEPPRLCLYPVGTLIKIKDRYNLGLWKPSNILIGEQGEIGKFKQWATIKRKYRVETVEPEKVMDLAKEHEFQVSQEGIA